MGYRGARIIEQLELPLYPYPIRTRKLHKYWRAASERTRAANAEEAVAKLYAEMQSIRRVAAALQFSYTEIHTILREIGVVRRGRGGNNNPYGRAGRPDKERW